MHVYGFNTRTTSQPHRGEKRVAKLYALLRWLNYGLSHFFPLLLLAVEYRFISIFYFLACGIRFPILQSYHFVKPQRERASTHAFIFLSMIYILSLVVHLFFVYFVHTFAIHRNDHINDDYVLVISFWSWIISNFVLRYISVYYCFFFFIVVGILIARSNIICRFYFDLDRLRCQFSDAIFFYI